MTLVCITEFHKFSNKYLDLPSDNSESVSGWQYSVILEIKLASSVLSRPTVPCIISAVEILFFVELEQFPWMQVLCYVFSDYLVINSSIDCLGVG